ncbi:hypothetical protein EMIHUDRAFT_467237 [Emiliania huxleyi CCMP1516]|uniref:FAD-binding oxidoreductase/transferase type 4 C-terminal domain-containing protein n=2 Tax=Emiliania huxleyi TaxID=2903 RepID=A0A0D3KK37_EMIH1|nr:hypothetical protein EMIHUDRAFT_467237 [Emiliania huxleyi CCMP1516]EOD36122.1 hypothetical protein EMIHUDRAFT_467237 [Emiliania huxleyi CCMP1516]|eukprot:XP_005788551.1 hypothetical protein EMIHUDRAFT_467237 [Emiliania huxleyi CCMP1516]
MSHQRQLITADESPAAVDHSRCVTSGSWSQAAIEPYVFEWIAERRGSISAEHGVGVMKPPFLHMSKSDGMIGVMRGAPSRGIKTMLDPNNILNPLKVLPPLEAAAEEREAVAN